MADHVEVERKFDVDPGFALPDLSAVPGCAKVSGPVVHSLSATYYDTADLRLAARGITLRQRTGGSDDGWHLKLPAGEPGSRRELQEPPGPRVPERLAARIADATAGQALRPVARLDTTRTVLILMTEAGSPLVEVADDVVTAERADAPGRPVTWREVEVEVAAAGPGGRSALEAAADALRAAGARASGSGSKLARALAER